MTSQSPMLLGHRGAKRYAPENTSEAFRLCEDHGCDGFEFDVRLTADGNAVCCHDATWNNMQVDAARAGELELETLSSALSFADRLYLDVEMKTIGIVPKLAFVLRTLDPNRAVISSFLPEVVFETRLFVPNLSAGLICRTAEQLSEFDAVNADILIAHQSLITRKLVEHIHDRGKTIFTWTVNDAQKMRDLAGMGVDAIISDDTRLMVQILRPRAMRVSA
ncbi:MAG: glycerophosphodiester phosphodiesterase [Acidobacteriaceae bacterium]